MFNNGSQDISSLLDNNRKTFSNKWLVIIFSLVAVLTLGLVGYFIYINNTLGLSSKKESIDENIQTTTPNYDAVKIKQLQEESMILVRYVNSINYNKNDNFLSRIRLYSKADEKLKIFSQAGSVITYNGIFEKLSNEGENYKLTLNSFDFVSKIDLIFTLEEINNAKVKFLKENAENLIDMDIKDIRKNQFVFIRDYYNYFDDKDASDLYIEVRNYF